MDDFFEGDTSVPQTGISPTQQPQQSQTPTGQTPVIADEPYQPPSAGSQGGFGYGNTAPANTDGDDFGGFSGTNNAATQGYEAPKFDGGFFGGSQTNEFNRPSPLAFPNQIKTQEEIEEDERLRAFNDKKQREIEEKEDLERQQKSERRSKAAEILKNWMSDWNGAVDKRKQINKERQTEHEDHKKNNTEYKHAWDKIIGNVSIKEADYQGTKDVSRFRSALLNKKLDEAGKSNGGVASEIKF